ncbi:hypothetical protein JCM5353_006113 [Sporobolomyces roseus]
MSRLPPLESTSPLDWNHLAEGGANLVLSYSGSQPLYDGRVLRLRKRKKLQHTTIAGQADLDFAKEIIEPLLGTDQIAEMGLIQLDREWLRRLSEVLVKRGSRSKEREDEDEIDLEGQFGVIAEDLVGGGGGIQGVIAFEIKPKWGFLPSSNHLSYSTSSIKTTYCRFCMHRYYRTNSINEHEEGYCPLDLCSGDSMRVRKAIDSLFSIWETSQGEANNFRIFMNGQAIRPNDSSAVASTFDLISNHFEPPQIDRSLRSIVPSLLVPALESSPLLSTLSHLQSSLGSLDIEGLTSLISSQSVIDFHSPSGDLTPLGPQPSIEEWRSFLTSFQSSSPLDLRQSILSFLLSATFKDCSIIVRFAQDRETKEIETKVKAIDLDPKPIKKLGSWLKLDQEIVKSWKRMLDELSDEERRGLRKCSNRTSSEECIQ